MTGKDIRAWRERKGLSRDELAAAIHTTYASIANWELDRSKPSGAAASILDGMMSGEIAVIPLTEQEERLLDEAVKRGGFKSRKDFLTHILVEVIKGEGDPKPGKIVPLPGDSLSSKVAEGE